MSACCICPDPGVCCRRFKLDCRFDAESDVHEVQKRIERMRDRDGNRYPFEAVRRVSEDEGEDEVRWVFRCPKLGPDGRCTIYDERPDCCRNYLPGEDELCVLHGEGFELLLPVLPEVSSCGPREGAGLERPQAEGPVPAGCLVESSRPQ